MTIKVEKNLCTGCSACKNVCSYDAISMVEDNEGFLYPKVNLKKCKDCNRCKQVCPTINNTICNNEKVPKVYAAKSLDKEIVKNSSSGGIFSEFAKDILMQRGYVVGAKYNSELLVEHDIVHNINNLKTLQKSKYVQSKIGYVYRDVKELLDNDEKVLFVGTPCQTAGIKSYLNKEYEDLIICDLICHGVNSPAVYIDYLKCMEKRYGSKVCTIDFRDKINGWKDFGTKIVFASEQEYYKSHKKDFFYRGFMQNLFLRPSCYKCKYKGYNRISDITIADFWGVNLFDKCSKIDDGISLVLIHSEKGDRYFQKLKKRLFIEEHTIGEASAKNPCLVRAVGENELRNEFFRRYAEKAKDIDQTISELLDRSTK